MTLPAPIDTTQDGLPVYDRKPAKMGGEIILAQWHTGFVTWLRDQTGDCYLGHYLPTFQEAQDDFASRN